MKMERKFSISGTQIAHTDLVRFWVIASLTMCCIVITSLSLARHVETIYAQLFYFPILYATYFYPRKGLFLAGGCAVVYEILAYIYVFPDIGGMLYTTAQAILFICVAAVVSYFTEKVNTSEARYRSIFENSLLGIVLFDQNSFAIRLTNTELGKMLGYSFEELGSMTFSELFVSRFEQSRFFERLGSSEDIIDFETCFATKTKEAFWVNLSWSRLSANLVSCSVIDVNQRRFAERAAEENFYQYKQVTESSPTAIVIVQDRKIVFLNPAFKTFSGHDPDELLGHDIVSILHPEDREGFPDMTWSEDSRASLPDMEEYRFLTKTGETRLGALFFTRIVQRGTPAVLINLVDITEREKLKERIKQDNDRRRGIISTVAHELRTPLQPIMGYLNLLTEDPKTYGVTDETRAILDRCAKSVDRERQIINQMLELSVLDSGKIPLKYSHFSLAGLLGPVIDAGGYATKADVTVDVPEGVTIDADENKISIVVDSMLSNAVNYSKPPRKIRITYVSVPGDAYHRIAIQDNGVGITEAQLDEIFEPFQLPDSASISRKYDRIGLSLSIAKKYIQMHGGYISVDSIVNLGSTFTIHIPKQRPAEAANNDA
jgi:PAS domain S-box-containing protein